MTHGSPEALRPIRAYADLMRVTLPISAGAALGAALMCGGFGGCQAHHNDRLEIGSATGGVLLPDLSPQPVRGTPASDEPTTTTLSRADWVQTEIMVPVDGIYAFRRYARLPHRTDDTARQRLEPVTPLSALEQEGDTRADRWREIGISPFHAMWEGVLIVPRMFFVSPNEEIRSLPTSYARTPLDVSRTVSTPAQGEPIEDPE